MASLERDEIDVEAVNVVQVEEEQQVLELDVLPPYEEYRKYKVFFFLSICLICPLLLSPGIYVLLMYGMREAFKHKLIPALQAREWVCAVAQSSILASLSVLAWTVSQTLAVIIPYGQLRFRKNPKPSTVRSLNALLQTRIYSARALFLILLLFILAGFLYDTTLLHTALQSLSKRVSGANTNGDPLPTSWVYYIERVQVCAVIFAFVFFIFNYLLNLVLYSFHATTFGLRIHIANSNLQVLSDLYRAVCTEESRFLHGLQDQLSLSSEHRAAAIAKALFESLSEDGQELTSQAITSRFEDASFAKKVNRLLSSGKSEEAIKLEDVVNCVTRLYTERKNILKSLKSNREIMHKLDGLFRTIATVTSALLCTPFLDLGVTTLWAGFLALFSALGFALQSVGRTSFEAMLFLFVVHSFDIGDVVLIDGDKLYVEHIEVFSTEFRWVESGDIMYSPNPSLSSKNITNISRTEREKQLKSK